MWALDPESRVLLSSQRPHQHTRDLSSKQQWVWATLPFLLAWEYHSALTLCSPTWLRWNRMLSHGQAGRQLSGTPISVKRPLPTTPPTRQSQPVLWKLAETERLTCLNKQVLWHRTSRDNFLRKLESKSDNEATAHQMNSSSDSLSACHLISPGGVTMAQAVRFFLP